MGKHSLILLGLAVLAAPVSAEEPNMEAGLWEYVNTTVIEGGPMGRQEQEQTHQQCITESDLAEADFMTENEDNCQISNREQTASSLSYEMSCQDQSGMSINMVADIRFLGERLEGTMNGSMVSPMGEMDMEVTMQGQRIGECDGDESGR